MKKTIKKTAFQIMYETVIERGGPKGLFSKAVVDAYKDKSICATNPQENKVIIQFRKEVPCPLK